MSTGNSETSKKIFFTYNHEKANSKEIIELSNVPNHFVGIGFFDSEIFDENNNCLGNVVYNYFIQETKDNKFSVRYDATFFLKEKGSISWKYDIIQNEPNCFYSLEELHKARIISSTGIYEEKTGKVFLYADKVGNVFITITFDELNNNLQKNLENEKMHQNEKIFKNEKIFEETKEKIFENKNEDDSFFNNSHQSSRFSLRKSRKWS